MNDDSSFGASAPLYGILPADKNVLIKFRQRPDDCGETGDIAIPPGVDYRLVNYAPFAGRRTQMMWSDAHAFDIADCVALHGEVLVSVLIHF